MKHFISSIVTLLIVFLCKAQDYNVLFIPDSLKANANAVLRKDEHFLEIKDIDKAVYHHKYAITILNEYGAEHAVFAESYDKLVSLRDINGTMYDALGNKIKTARRKDIYDESNDGSSFLTDNRVKSFSFKNNTYPFTVEFEYELVFHGIFFLPEWMPISSYNLSVQESKIEVETSKDYKLRFKQINFNEKPKIIEDGKLKYSWQIKNKKAIKREVLSNTLMNTSPLIMIAPTDFSIESFSGNMQNWSEFGKFISKLNIGKNEIPQALKTQLHQLTDGIKNIEKKIEVLFNYLQQNSRYISIQLGIGGWQPLAASFVAEKKYGDCKALSNFMISILKEIGVNACYVLINAGSQNQTFVDDEFSRNRFNHAICCVPLEKDTIWLECTSQKVSAGYMGSFTGNRKALLINDKGGFVVNTPNYTAKENVKKRSIKAMLDDQGNLKLHSEGNFSGVEQELESDLLNELNEENRIKYLNKAFDLPTYNVDKIEYKEIKNKLPVILESMDITASNYANLSGKRLFIAPNLLNRESLLDIEEKRESDIFIKWAKTEIDSIEIKIPIGYAVESQPKNVELNTEFGNYKIEFSYKNGQINVVRKFIKNSGTFSSNSFNNFLEFNNKMAKADASKFVFVKNL